MCCFLFLFRYVQNQLQERYLVDHEDVALGTWYHVALVYAHADRVVLYINGVVEASDLDADTQGAPFPPGKGELQIGRKFIGEF